MYCFTGQPLPKGGEALNAHSRRYAMVISDRKDVTADTSDPVNPAEAS